ncbi:tRNA 2'-phosphotransferase 1-like isoform X4 [Mobula birostris]|uniref:tRNA 2'-phosphotransferase 1-like isoform X4 n=1 Tax=Mobula birostris TaxID=1983395 RepID=UPI003B27DA5E
MVLGETSGEAHFPPLTVNRATKDHRIASNLLPPPHFADINWSGRDQERIQEERDPENGTRRPLTASFPALGRSDAEGAGGRGSPASGRRGRHRPGREQDPDVRLSKALSYALRHGATQLGLELQKDGFLPVDAILRHPQFRRYTVQDVQRVVDTNDKRRFTLHTDPATGSLKIRANQGHTLQVEELELTPISLGGGNLPAQAVHGTYLRHWPLIKAQGLRRQSRQHIHLAPGLPEDDSIISGMRSSCELAIFVELEKALNDGIPFYLSTNQVILTPGNEDGVLPPKYFQKVLQLKPTRRLLPLQ